MLNKIYKNNQNLEFKVLKLDRIDSNHKKYYTIQFLKSGYLKENVRGDIIKAGSIRDNLTPSFLNIGCLGYAGSKGDNKRYYSVWSGMMSRCYSPNDKAYRFYGLKGCRVCKRWHRFDLFLEDIKLLDGYDEKLFLENKIKLDKDILSNSNGKLYSKDTCIFISNDENQHQRAKEYNLKNKKYVIFPNGEIQLLENVTQFCKHHNLPKSSVYKCLKGEYNDIHGFKFFKK